MSAPDPPPARSSNRTGDLTELEISTSPRATENWLDDVIGRGTPAWHYRYEWGYFADWCAAYDCVAFPASPLTVARFLQDDPAKNATLRRRVTAINSVHAACGVERPGTAAAVRRLLSVRRRHRRQAYSAITELPVRGWPAGLFGRRDALLLWLVCLADVPPSAIATMQRSDLSADSNCVLIGGGHDIEIPLDEEDWFGLLPVWRRWGKIQELLERQPSPRALVLPLMNAEPLKVSAKPLLEPPNPPQRRDSALLPPINQWGYSPLDTSRGLSEAAVRRIVASRLSGVTARAPLRDAWVRSIIDADRDPEPDEYAVSVLPDRHSQGVEAKRRALDDLKDLEGSLELISSGADELLAWTEKILAELGDDGSELGR